ncbi:MAG: chemotaxis protein CheW [Spirochaetes bacterium]|nr:chemotaxis protein CheW [Spirochaetota bacterium]
MVSNEIRERINELLSEEFDIKVPLSDAAPVSSGKKIKRAKPAKKEKLPLKPQDQTTDKRSVDKKKKKPSSKVTAPLVPRPPATRLLLFSLGQDHYSACLLDLDEIQSYYNIIPIPGNELVEGILPHRGKIVTIVDINKVLQIEPSRQNLPIPLPLVITGSLGFKVDRIIDIIQIDNSRIKKISPAEEKMKTSYIDRTVQYKNKPVGIINLKKLLSQNFTSS